MFNKTVSIVMATYNGADYINLQLESLINQTMMPVEIIISDDGSTDNTMDIVHKFMRNDKIKVKLLENKSRIGFRENFLQAASEACGDFVAFCDQDDIWRDDKLEKCAAYFDNLEVSMITHCATLIDKSSNSIGEFRQGIKETSIRPPLSYDPWGTFYGFSIVFRRELLDIFPLNQRFLDYISPDHLIAHDRWITFLAQMVGWVVEIDDCLVKYRQHDNNAFGHKALAKNRIRDEMANRSNIYITATSQMIDILKKIHLGDDKEFPSFDRKKCTDFIERALDQLKNRDKIYVSKTKTESLYNLYIATRLRSYIGVNDRKLRWRSLGRDIKYVTLDR